MKGNLNVAVFTNTFLPRLAGPAISIGNLSERLISKGTILHIVAPEYRSMFMYRSMESRVTRTASLRVWGVRRWALPLPYLSKLSIKEVLSQVEPDVIHIHQPFLLGMLGFKEACRRGTPIVYTYHTFYEYYSHYATNVASDLSKKLVTERQRLICNQVDHIVAPTRLVADRIRQSGVRTPLTVIPTGISTRRFASRALPLVRHKVRGALRIGEEQRLLLHVGRLGKEKNVDFLIEVLRRLNRRGDDFVLLFVGGGSHERALRREVARLGCGSAVRWVGLQPQEKLPDYYASADLFVFPSVSDTQAIVLYEALAAGLPIVAVDSLAARAAIKEGADGLIVPCDPADFASAVHDCVAARHRLSPRLEDHLQLEATVSKYAELYRKVAAEGPFVLADSAVPQPPHRPVDVRSHWR